MALSIDVTEDTAGAVWKVSLRGEIDISNAQDFKAKLETALAEKKQDIEIDLKGLTYIDSTGLGVIIGVYGGIKKDGFCVKVQNPRDNVKKLLNVSGLDKILC